VENVFNDAHWSVQNLDGINQLRYNPIGTNCGDDMTLNRTCHLAPHSGPGNFGALQEIRPKPPAARGAILCPLYVLR
jgi:hypothetical protein